MFRYRTLSFIIIRLISRLNSTHTLTIKVDANSQKSLNQETC
ncbi:hypothetical protein HanIR_Chr16g0831731 [Helianthus annuus]|nr:hypothetical protein HanIR_Chr16g0831731 [Helianthus annuus]